MSENLKVLIGENDIRFNACLDQWTSLADAHPEGFKRSTEILLQYFLHDIESAASDRDTVVLPILFLFRHYLEIRFKEIISNGKRLLGESTEWPSGHNLHELWTKCLSVCSENYGSKIPDPDDVNLIDKCVYDLRQLDPTSQNFRYPTDRRGNVPFTHVVISLRILNDVFKRVADLLEGISMDISVKCDHLRDQ